jgi:ATP-binding cassette subfamily B protein
MISKFYGRYHSLESLRLKSYLNREGVSLLGISDCAEQIGFRTIGVKIDFEKLAHDVPLPCIVHWNQNHFIVVYKITKNKIYVADPAMGLLTYEISAFTRSWISTKDINGEKGIALILEPTPEFYDQEQGIENQTKKNVWILWDYIKYNRALLLQLLFGLLVSSLISLSLPFLTQAIVDIGVNTKNLNFINLVLIGQLTLLFSRLIVDFIRRWVLLNLSTRISIALISNFLSKLFKLPISFFDGKMIGDILRRIDDHSRVEKFISTSSLSILFSFFNVLIFGFVLLSYSIKIFIVFVCLSALYVLYVIMFLKKRAELDYKRFQHLANNESSLIQTVQGMVEIKMNNCEMQKRWEWERIQAKLFKVSIESTKLQQIQDSGSFFINEGKNVLITILSASAVIHGEITLGMMLAIQYIVSQLNSPINDFIVFTRDLQDAKISLDRIGEVQNLKDEDEFTNDELKKQELEGSLFLKNVTFQYEGPLSPKVLNSLSLTIPYGKVTAIVGSSGSGKTTLMKLLLKFYKPTEGLICVKDKNLTTIKSTQWRSVCGTVMQDGFIFSDSIARNIALTGENIDFNRVTYAAKIANINDFIDSLPLGYNTKIGGNGIGISQGQKQRILIARAVYKNPDYLFFDEATSSLDANNEKIIMNNLMEFFKNRTVLVIAHRLSTVINADKIIVLDRGIIAESGTHDELIKLGGIYYELIKNQLALGA